MDISDDVLNFDEKAIIRLRSLYRKFGYTQYKMSRFEEYGLYAENKSFLASGEIITFTGAGGKLMALRPDVTLSIVKNLEDDDGCKKIYYNENVYKPDGFEFKEQMQVGLECLGDIDVVLMGEVLMLAHRSLELLGEHFRLDISHMGYISGLLHSEELTVEQRAELLRLVGEKNASGLNMLCAEYGFDECFRDRLTALISLYGTYGEIKPELRRLSVNEETEAALREIEEIHEVLSRLDSVREVNYDFSIVNDLSYYSGVIFQGYIEGIPAKVLSGGRYDRLMRKFGKRAGAVGFAVYLDLLERRSPPDEIINIALPKGRLGDKAYGIFEAAGYGCPAIYEESRRLVFENKENGIRFFWVKPSDVAKYVERGAADIGVAGKDILLEYSPDVYELLDLGIGKCRMCIAAEQGFSPEKHTRVLRVATKYPNIARDYYEKQGRAIDIIGLNGSIELAPILGLSDVIVDIVETGKTLLENKLRPFTTIVDISARLISNKVSYKFNFDAISKLCGRIGKNLNGR